MDIETILQHIAKGNRQAFAPLVERYQRPLFSYLGRMGFSQAQAEDLAQETFTRAWQHLGQYDAHRAEFSTAASRGLRHSCRSFCRGLGSFITASGIRQPGCFWALGCW